MEHHYVEFHHTFFVLRETLDKSCSLFLSVAVGTRPLMIVLNFWRIMEKWR